MNKYLKESVLWVLIVLPYVYLAAIRPNYFIGIRTPWTLENEQI
jgi:uncharacterized membrane protein